MVIFSSENDECQFVLLWLNNEYISTLVINFKRENCIQRNSNYKISRMTALKKSRFVKAIRFCIQVMRSKDLVQNFDLLL